MENLNDLIDDKEPTFKLDSGYQIWIEHNSYHRKNGPAIIYPNGKVEWAIYGVTYNFNEWCIAAKIHDELKIMLMLRYNCHE